MAFLNHNIQHKGNFFLVGEINICVKYKYLGAEEKRSKRPRKNDQTNKQTLKYYLKISNKLHKLLEKA